MPQVVIENPVLNSPFEEPQRHFRFSDEGITNEIVETRRVSSYFIPIPDPSRGQARATLIRHRMDAEERIKENDFHQSACASGWRIWRQGGYLGRHQTTAELLEYWQRPDRERRLFFCQIEAMETAIYLTEVANKYGERGSRTNCGRFNQDANPLLCRVAFKMATGSGKTVVMAMLIAWHALNKLANPQDARFSDTFLIVTPGITIRDRLRVLLPNDPQNYYRAARHRSARPASTNSARPRSSSPTFTQFKLREQIEAGQTHQRAFWAARRDRARSRRHPTRWCAASAASWATRRTSSSSTMKRITAIAANPMAKEMKLTGEERKEAEQREEEARIWISGWKRSKPKSASSACTTCPRRRSFCAARAIPKAHFSPGWSRISR